MDLVCEHGKLDEMCRIIVNSTDWMEEELSSGSWTIFAFADNAFGNLREERSISADAEIAVTKFHIVEKKTILLAENLDSTDEIKMYNGFRTHTVCRNGEKGQKGGGNTNRILFRTTDLKAVNGVVHILEEILFDKNIDKNAPLFEDNSNISR